VDVLRALSKSSNAKVSSSFLVDFGLPAACFGEMELSTKMLAERLELSPPVPI
jgi:hypothetical protein